MSFIYLFDQFKNMVHWQKQTLTYYIHIIFNVYKMLNPTFASFKTVKQGNSNGHVLHDLNPNLQPKTFYELKTSTHLTKQPH